MFKQLRKERGERGFTLVELLVVIAILGVLSGVAVFSLSSVGDNGATEACKVERSVLTTAVAVYKQQNDGAIPTMGDLTGADILSGTPKYWTLDAAGDPVKAGTAPAAC